MKTILATTTIFLILTISVFSQEVQVAMDNDNKIISIDSKLEKKLNLFSEYSGLSEVKLFQNSDSIFILEIECIINDRIYRTRKILTLQETQDFRNLISTTINKVAPEKNMNQDGRLALLINSSIISLGLYGWAIPASMYSLDDRGAIGLYMLTAGSGFFVPYFLTKERKVTNADACLNIFGQSRGIAQGVFFPYLINNDFDDRIYILSGMAFSIAEGFGGYMWADRTNMTPGKALTIGAIGDFGLGLGLCTAHLFDFFYNDDLRGISGSILAGSAVGIIGGNYLAKKTNYSTGDALVMRGTGILGALVPFTATVLFDPNDEKFYTVSTCFGTLGGIAIGHMMAQKNDYTSGQGIMIDLCGAAAGLIGLGIGYISCSNDDILNKVLAVSGTAGAIGGFTVMSHYQSGKYKKNIKKKKDETTFGFNINPSGLMELAGVKSPSTKLPPQSLFTASLRF